MMAKFLGGDMTYVLLVEDNASVREMTEIMLQIIGFAVVSVGSADEALQAFVGKSHDSWHAVLSDINMPGQSGISLCGEINSLAPDVPFFLMSATPPNEIDIPKGCAGFMPKPFYPKDLRKLLSI